MEKLEIALRVMDAGISRKCEDGLSSLFRCALEGLICRKRD